MTGSGKTSIKIKSVIMAVALIMGAVFSLTACGSSSEVSSVAVTEASTDEAITTEESAEEASSGESKDNVETEDGTYTGNITAVSDTSVTISVMGGGQPQDNAGEAPSGNKPDDSGEAPSGDKPDDSGEAPSGDKPDDSGEAPSGDKPVDAGGAPSGAGEEKTFTVTTDQISDYTTGQMITVTVENGEVTSIEEAEQPADAPTAPTDNGDAAATTE
ncbi:MAG: hypothetical protein GX685_00355 [Clostridiales bacterium]|nr:hypothetical protein [Clostridiales bacterium]